MGKDEWEDPSTNRQWSLTSYPSTFWMATLSGKTNHPKGNESPQVTIPTFLATIHSKQSHKLQMWDLTLEALVKVECLPPLPHPVIFGGPAQGTHSYPRAQGVGRSTSL